MASSSLKPLVSSYSGEIFTALSVIIFLFI